MSAICLVSSSRVRALAIASRGCSTLQPGGAREHTERSSPGGIRRSYAECPARSGCRDAERCSARTPGLASTPRYAYRSPRDIAGGPSPRSLTGFVASAVHAPPTPCGAGVAAARSAPPVYALAWLSLCPPSHLGASRRTQSQPRSVDVADELVAVDLILPAARRHMECVVIASIRLSEDRHHDLGTLRQVELRIERLENALHCTPTDGTAHGASPLSVAHHTSRFS